MVAAQLNQPGPVAGLERCDHRPMLGAGQRQMRGLAAVIERAP